MELASITFWQVAILFMLIFTGVLSVKTGALTGAAKSVLSDLLLYVIVPAMIVNSYIAEYDPEVGRGIGRTFLYSAALIFMGLLLTLLLFRNRNNPNIALCRFACVFSNAGYMGYPLAHALFGNEGLMYASAYVTVFNLFLWTIGIRLAGGGESRGNAWSAMLKNPALWAVATGLMIYFLRLPVPETLRIPISSIGAMNTPVSMIITGMLLVGSDAAGLLKNARLWKTIGIRLLLIPAVCAAVFFALGIRGMPAQVTLLQEACPCAAMTSVLAVQFHHDESFAGGLVVISTLLSIATLPLCALLLTM